jgi:hypothetical protein
MSGYLSNIPQPSQLQSVSQGQFLTNFGILNSSYGIDHYDYTTTGANTGFHHQVTTPARIGGAPAIGSTPILYAIQATANTGLIQYSLGNTLSGPATPLTSMQSPSAGVLVGNNNTVNVFNFTGVTQAIAMVYMSAGTSEAYINSALVAYYSGTVVVKANTGTGLTASASGQNLIITNTTGGSVTIYWTLQFIRIQ